MGGSTKERNFRPNCDRIPSRQNHLQTSYYSSKSHCVVQCTFLWCCLLCCTFESVDDILKCAQCNKTGMLERFPVECHKTRTKVITVANATDVNNNEPIRIQSKYM